MRIGGLYDRLIEKNIPLFACFEINTDCNNRCVHCYNTERHVLPLDALKRCMDEAADMGTLFLSITGGEPLLREDIWQILSYSARKNFATLLYTNATLIGREEALRLKEAGVYHVDTTLLGADPQTHDGLSGVKGSFDKTLKALELLKEQGISIAVKTPVMNRNADTIDDIQSLVESMGVLHIASPLIFARDDGDPAPLEYRASDEQLRSFFSSRALKSLFDNGACYSCHFGRCTFALRADGEVTPCISVPLSLGNVNERSLKEIWSDNPLLDHLRDAASRPLPECCGCEMAGWCFRCEGISFTEEGRLFARSGELCRMARIRKEVSHDRTEEHGEEKVRQAAG
ncbi:MAG: radical SAM protein [Candidatus Omnitrophica bacterium]|nr:radical SAM protein [Candidatus Omnitrophota bacterium]